MGQGEEATSIANMLIKIFITLLIIGLVVTAVYFLYNKANGAVADLGTQLDSAHDATFTANDNKVVSGNDVVATLKQLRGSDYAIIIADGANPSYYTEATGNSAGTTVSGYNYNALITGATAGSATSVTYDDEGHFVAAGGIDYETSGTGAATLNTNYAPVSNKTATATYVKLRGRYYATLLYSDVTDAICGVVYQRME